MQNLTFPKNHTTSITIKDANLIVAHNTKFQKIEIWETSQYGKIVFINGWLQSIEHDEFIYHEFLVHPAFNLSQSKCQNILIIGGGEGALLREVLKYKSIKKITMVDIDAEFIDICKNHLLSFHNDAFKDERVQVIFEDGRNFLENSKEKFDAIILDLTAPDKGCPSVYLYTSEWYSLVSNCLAEDGVLSAYALSANLGESYPFACIIKTLEQYFANVLPMMIDMQVDGEKIGMAVASKGTLNAIPFDIESSMIRKMIDTAKYIDNISLHRSFLLPKYISDILKSDSSKIITDSNPLYM